MPRENLSHRANLSHFARVKRFALAFGLLAATFGGWGQGAAYAQSPDYCEKRIHYLHDTDRTIGRDDAPVRFTMYGSLACPHCKLFATDTWDFLVEQVRRGYVRFDF